MVAVEGDDNEGAKDEQESAEPITSRARKKSIAEKIENWKGSSKLDYLAAVHAHMSTKW